MHDQQQRRYAFSEVWPLVVGAYAVTAWILLLVVVAA